MYYLCALGLPAGAAPTCPWCGPARTSAFLRGEVVDLGRPAADRGRDPGRAGRTACRSTGRPCGASATCGGRCGRCSSAPTTWPSCMGDPVGAPPVHGRGGRRACGRRRRRWLPPYERALRQRNRLLKDWEGRRRRRASRTRGLGRGADRERRGPDGASRRGRRAHPRARRGRVRSPRGAGRRHARWSRTRPRCPAIRSRMRSRLRSLRPACRRARPANDAGGAAPRRPGAGRRRTWRRAASPRTGRPGGRRWPAAGAWRQRWRTRSARTRCSSWTIRSPGSTLARRERLAGAVGRARPGHHRACPTGPRCPPVPPCWVSKEAALPRSRPRRDGPEGPHGDSVRSWTS